jgi:hypothetical protein
MSIRQFGASRLAVEPCYLGIRRGPWNIDPLDRGSTVWRLVFADAREPEHGATRHRTRKFCSLSDAESTEYPVENILRVSRADDAA